MTHVPIEPIIPIASIVTAAPEPAAPSVALSFGQTLIHGLNAANDKLVEAENMVKAFATDESVPIHQVAYALDAARTEFELAMQVRGKMLEAYQQLMNMQL